jgi:hypothetical protein
MGLYEGAESQEVSLEGHALGGLLLQSILSLEPVAPGVLPRGGGIVTALGLAVAVVPYVACGITSAGSKRSPFFQTAEVMAATLRATVRRANAGRIPCSTKWS